MAFSGSSKPDIDRAKSRSSCRRIRLANPLLAGLNGVIGFGRALCQFVNQPFPYREVLPQADFGILHDGIGSALGVRDFGQGTPCSVSGQP